MGNTDRIAAVLADLESQVAPNYSATAKKHGVAGTNLMRRFTEATTEHRQGLNIAQENVLVDHTQRSSNVHWLCPFRGSS